METLSKVTVNKRPLAVLAAWVCAATPFAVAFLFNYVQANYPAAAGSLSLGALALLAFGVASGVYALTQARKHGAKRIVPWSVLGILVTLVILFLAYRGFTGYLERAKTQRAQVAVERRQAGEDVVLKRAGWMGSAFPAGAPEVNVFGSSVPADTEVYRFYMSNFTKNLTVLQVVVNNQKGRSNHTVGSGVTLALNGGQRVKSMNVADINPLIKVESKALSKLFQEAHTVRPGSIKSDFLVLFDATVDWMAVESFLITVDGAEYEIKGRYYTEDEKRQLRQQKMPKQ